MVFILSLILVLGVANCFRIKLHRDKAMHAFCHISDANNRGLFKALDAQLWRWVVGYLVATPVLAILWLLHNF